MKITITNIDSFGDTYGTLYNKTDDDIWHIGQIYTLNGKTNEWYEKPKKAYKPEKETSFVLLSYKWDEENNVRWEGKSKVVKNKMTFKKEDAVFVYRYKNKDYKINLKIGGTETHDVYYTQDSIFTDHDKIRKEQLGY